MNVLYKYCDREGVEGILRTLELKLPYISDVNDPLECLPYLYCPDDKAAIDERCLSAFERDNRPLPVDYKEKLDELIEEGKIQNDLVDAHRKVLEEYNRTKGCLLSVSDNAKETVMWAHYAERHKGGVIGIDFDNICPTTNKPVGIKMRSVDYSENRPKINVLEEPEESISEEEIRKTVGTKSIGWSYEKEYRAIFLVDALETLQQQGLAHLEDFNGRKTWFLRLNTESIREIVFGLFTEDSLRLAIRKLVERPELQHVKLHQAEEAETYTLNLKVIA